MKIFITVGSQKFQFNRLLMKMDEILSVYKSSFSVFAQIGCSTYLPKNYQYTNFMEKNEFVKKIKNADLIITHGGTGAIITSLNYDKPVIAVARLKKYDEHVDDHQKEIIETFCNAGYILGTTDENEIYNLIVTSNTYNFTKFISNTNNFVKQLKKDIKVIFD